MGAFTDCGGSLPDGRQPALEVPAHVLLVGKRTYKEGDGAVAVGPEQLWWAVPKHWPSDAWTGSLPFPAIEEIERVHPDELQVTAERHTAVMGGTGAHLDLAEQRRLIIVGDRDRLSELQQRLTERVPLASAS